MKIAHVDWIDSHGGDSGWETLKGAREDAAKAHSLRMSTCGHLIDETEEYVLLALSWSPSGADSDDELISATMQIPRIAVVAMTTWELPERPRFSGLAQDQPLEQRSDQVVGRGPLP